MGCGWARVTKECAGEGDRSQWSALDSGSCLNKLTQLRKIGDARRQFAGQSVIRDGTALNAHGLKAKLCSRMCIPAVARNKTNRWRILQSELLHSQSVNAATGLINSHLFHRKDIFKSFIPTHTAQHRIQHGWAPVGKNSEAFAARPQGLHSCN